MGRLLTQIVNKVVGTCAANLQFHRAARVYLEPLGST
jgi:hypothetical protein